MTPAPISVERLRELLDKATPSTGWVVTYDGFSVVTDDEPMHRIHVASCVEPDDAALIAEAINALPALLQQLAELQAKTACTLGVGDGSGQLFVHGDYESIKAAQGIIDKLAEREAEVAFARETLAKALDVGDVSDEPLRTLAIRASNALYWRDQHRQEAERAREEAERDLRAIYEAVPGLPIYATEEDADRATDAFTAICHLCNEYIASGAASGGSNG